jgi:hypothetical protein
VTSKKSFNSYEIFYDWIKKGALLIQVTAWTGLTIYIAKGNYYEIDKKDLFFFALLLLQY